MKCLVLRKALQRDFTLGQTLALYKFLIWTLLGKFNKNVLNDLLDHLGRHILVWFVLAWFIFFSQFAEV